MKKFIDDNIFINNDDSCNINSYTDVGMILSNSTFGLHNYLYDIPLLYVTESTDYFEKWYKPYIGEKYKKSVLFGKVTNYDNLLQNPEKLLHSFIKNYKSKIGNKNNNILYSNTNCNNDVNLANYIDDIILKNNEK